MPTRWTTLTEYILRDEHNISHPTGSLTLLLNQIAEAGKIIASHVKNSGLIDIEGKTGERNIYKEEVLKLDKFSNDLLIDILTHSGQVSAIASEEMEKPVYVKRYAGEFVVFIDPLDGSSNIDNNNAIGTLFSVHQKHDGLLQEGRKQVAAGYLIYGSSVMFVYSCCGTVNGFTLDPSVGSFLLSHPNIRIPEEGKTYSINEGYFELYDSALKKFLNSLKKKDKPYKLRYVGSMTADIHRTLLKGGLFMYPSDKKNPHGKLRLMFEVNPLSLLVVRAGGLAQSGNVNPLEIKPAFLHQRVPIVLGSKEEVAKYLSFTRK
ncbi:class 1 fructose-bisphosphatase [Candidatus Roizmanbacteria bacterium]|nr:class 1 fructose-bisphosphatase [Candidatus Roizmanbacteria bacterium]